MSGKHKTRSRAAAEPPLVERKSAGPHAPYDLSVVIINYNTPALTAAAVQSVLATRGRITAEIVVVDNGSTRGNLATALGRHLAAESEGSEVRLIRSERNLGFTGGNNLGLKAARGATLLLLNSDTEVREGAIERATAYLGENPKVGVVGPKLLDLDGTRQLSCRRFPSFRTALFNRYSLMTRLFPRNRWSQAYLMGDAGEATEPRAVDWVSGAAMFIRRALWERIGELDERFFMYAEDVDYCLRAHLAGWEVHYLPAAEILHLIGESSRLLPFRTIWWRHRSMWEFYHKHYSRDIAFFDLATLAGIVARAAVKMGVTSVLRLGRLGRRGGATA